MCAVPHRSSQTTARRAVGCVARRAVVWPCRSFIAPRKPALFSGITVARETLRAALADPEAYVVHRPVAEGYRVIRHDDGSFEVVGRQAVRAVALSDLTQIDALDEAHRRLRSLGVDKALARAGAREGDEVTIGRLTFTYEDE